MFIPAELIRKKRLGQTHSVEEIKFLVQEFTKGQIPEYQMSAWLMAVLFQGLTQAETVSLTQAMIDSGAKISFPSPVNGNRDIIVDKHSTGGVGDKTSLILAPIAAAAGLVVPMMSGRGLGHSGGTLDKLESIPGFTTQLSLTQFEKQSFELGLCFVGQTAEICPADRKMYALRDVTATVESLPLICASIMSKKIAEGIHGLVLDVKYGSGAFMKTLADAQKLAAALTQIGRDNGLKVSGLISSMNQPLGRFVGNSLEIEECIAILKGEKLYSKAKDDHSPSKDISDTIELSLQLSALMLTTAKLAKDHQEAVIIAKKMLESGQAWEKFEQVCRAQGGDLNRLPQAKKRFEVLAKENGFIEKLDTERIGIASLRVGAGRVKVTDKIDPSSGLEVHIQLGQRVSKGDRLFTIYYNDPFTPDLSSQELCQSVSYSERAPGESSSQSLVGSELALIDGLIAEIWEAEPK